VYVMRVGDEEVLFVLDDMVMDEYVILMMELCWQRN
jgi:hypothetical protein